MAQIFPAGFNAFSRVTLYGGLLSLLPLVFVPYWLQRGPYTTRQDVTRIQPVQFSHKHHAGDDGIDCRYCHTSVETSPFAGLPPTETCMNCHREIWAYATMLQPVRQSFFTGEPLRWTRVYDLPDYVYFDHSVHVHKGVGCSTCHGDLDRMPLTWSVASLQMEWCLNCHRHPDRYLRPRAEVFSMQWRPPPDQEQQGLLLMQRYRVNGPALITSCTFCHR